MIDRVKSYMSKHSDDGIVAETSNLTMKPGRVKGTLLDTLRKRSYEGGVCAKCGLEVKRLTVDHIVPLHVLWSFDNAFEISANDPDNFQMLCEVCNRIKSGTLDMRNPKTAKLLQKYIQPYL